MSATPDSTLANPEELIADLRRQLAECKAERDECEAQKTAIAEVLQVINSSLGDLGPVFDAILEKAHSLCGVAYGGLLVCEGEELRVVAAHGDAPYIETRREQGRFHPPHGTPLWRLMHGESLIHLADATTDDAYGNVPAYARVVDAGQVRTLLQLPLRKEDKLLGVITAYRQQVRPFTDKEIALLENFAAQAVIAMENARLLTETRQALEQQTATAEVLKVINSSPGDLAPVFDTMLEKAMRLCGAAFGEMYSYDGEGFRTEALRGLPHAYHEFRLTWAPVARPGTVVAHFLAGERVVHVTDLKDETAYREGNSHRRAMVDLGGARTGLAVPLLQDETLRGAIMIYRQQVRPFSDKQIALLQNFAAQAVIAMENARLLTETREALAQQTATAEVLQVINSSPGDLTPVFEAMLEKATRLCEASFGLMNTYDGERFRAGAAHQVPTALVEWSERNPVQFGPGTAPARIAGGENLVHTVDLTATEAYQRGDPSRRALVDLGGARSHLIAALRKDGALLGTIAVYRQEIRPFSDRQSRYCRISRPRRLSLWRTHG